MNINIFSIFPDFTKTINDWSIIKRAIEKDLVNINSIDIREFSKDRHSKTDDYSYGGGPGMIMTPQPIFDALDTVKSDIKIYMSPRGKTLDQNLLRSLMKYENISILCGHYEGIDQRVIDNLIDLEISLGDYILSGGELPAMVLVDGLVRLIPQALNNEESIINESFDRNLLEYDQYTRPKEYRGLKVPDVLIEGNHKLIKEFRLKSSLKNTLLYRPDLLEKVELDEKENAILREIIEELEYSRGGK
ncbi:MAG: tRNA (guanosine(37)-N1)-methyltransferase TrmD [Tissierellia bacterium]|nr:tRNA (guanosine(37)-N1)-methyltransferase TrmD [Tissierellia bacterium]